MTEILKAVESLKFIKIKVPGKPWSQAFGERICTGTQDLTNLKMVTLGIH